MSGFLGGGPYLPITRTITAAGAYALTGDNYTVAFDCTLGSQTPTLPPVNSTNTGQIFIIKRVDASGNNVTITPTGSDLIDGGATRTVATMKSYVLQSTGLAASGWIIIASF